jgi:hypothetical protein
MLTTIDPVRISAKGAKSLEAAREKHHRFFILPGHTTHASPGGKDPPVGQKSDCFSRP